MGVVASDKPVSENGEGTQTPSNGGVVRADTRELLAAYFSVLDLVEEEGGTPMLRPPGRLSRLKPTVGLESYVTEHVRTNVDRFSRRYRARLALGQDDGNDEHDRAALEDFAASLPPHRARVWILLPYLAALAVTQVVVSIIGHKATVSVLHDLIGLFNLNPQQISTSADNLIRSDEYSKILGVMVIGSAALWLTFRPLMWGFRVKRMLLNGPGAFRRGEKKCELAKTASRLDVRRREEELCSRLGMPAPAESRLDLWIRATILVSPLLFGIAGVVLTISDPQDRVFDITLGVALLTPIALRLAWLSRCGRARVRYCDPALAARAKQVTREAIELTGLAAAEPAG